MRRCSRRPRRRSYPRCSGSVSSSSRSALRTARGDRRPLRGACSSVRLGDPHRNPGRRRTRLHALVRQSAPVVIGSAILITFLLGRRKALAFTLAMVIAVLVVARAVVGVSDVAVRQPIESNLDRPGYMIDRQPRRSSSRCRCPRSSRIPIESRSRTSSCRSSMPSSERLVRCRPLLGVVDARDRFLASSQSVLGFGGDASFSAGWAGSGSPPCVGDPGAERGAEDAVLAALTVLFLLGWLGYVITLVRFPRPTAIRSRPTPALSRPRGGDLRRLRRPWPGCARA